MQAADKHNTVLQSYSGRPEIYDANKALNERNEFKSIEREN